MANAQKLHNEGRKKLQLDPVAVEELAALGLTQKEMAGVLRCSVDTLDRNYREPMEAGWGRMKHSLKRAQFELGVNEKNSTMLIWLGKQHLGQRDKTETELSGEVAVKRVVADL